MKNVELKVVGNILTITIDLSKTYDRSKSGKSIIVATSEGNVAIPNTDVKIGINVYK